MAWPAYRIATDRWLKAVYEYLKAIPCIEGEIRFRAVDGRAEFWLG